MPVVVGDCEKGTALLPASISPCAEQAIIQLHLLGKWVRMGKVHWQMQRSLQHSLGLRKSGMRTPYEQEAGMCKAVRIPSTP